MTQYRVRWEIDVDAKSARAAALQALVIQRDPVAQATHFEVFKRDYADHYLNGVDIDLIKESLDLLKRQHGDEQ